MSQRHPELDCRPGSNDSTTLPNPRRSRASHATSSCRITHLLRCRSRDGLRPAAAGTATGTWRHALRSPGRRDAAQSDRASAAHRRTGRPPGGDRAARRRAASRSAHPIGFHASATRARGFRHSARASDATDRSARARAGCVTRRPARRARGAHRRSAGSRVGDVRHASRGIVRPSGDDAWSRPRQRWWPASR